MNSVLGWKIAGQKIYLIKTVEIEPIGNTKKKKCWIDWKHQINADFSTNLLKAFIKEEQQFSYITIFGNVQKIISEMSVFQFVCLDVNKGQGSQLKTIKVQILREIMI